MIPNNGTWFRWIIAIFVMAALGVGLFLTAPAHAGGQVALIYRGPGICKTNCADIFDSLVKRVGLIPRFVGPDEIDPDVFKNAAVWVQPGGEDDEVVAKMNPALRKNLLAFVSNGGGYVGFCAGGFLAANRLQIIDATADFYSNRGSRKAAIIPVRWKGAIRQLYFEEGPFFKELGEKVEVFAEYEDGSAAGIKAKHGQGWVVVTGPHPEAPPEWRRDNELSDADGMDYEQTDQLFRWAMGR